MKLISTLIAKKTLAVVLLVLMATFINGLKAAPSGLYRVFWNHFDVTVKENNTVELTWEVTEYNNKNFHIQHSLNGTDWKDIAVINSQNSAESLVSYSFTHTNKNTGKQFYRIKEVDTDIKLSGYSPVRTLMLKNEATTVSVWPSPATDQIRINNTDNSSTTKAQIYDLSGRMMTEKKLQANTNTIAISDLTAGTYIVRIANDNGVIYTQKITKQ
jgi:hypothetical protein